MAIDFKYFDELKHKLDCNRPLSAGLVKNLREELLLKWTYHSNAIEGNTLTLKETKVALEGITIGGKTIREHFEVLNHRDAILYVEELVATNQPLTEWHIKCVHQLILKNIDQENAGRYRSCNVTIAGAEHIPPNATQIADEMQAYVDWYQKHGQMLHPIERAARVHIDFVKIHPFVDGNGRTSRLLMNFELLKAGFPAIIFPIESRLDYYNALDTAHTTLNYDQFLSLTVKLLDESFKVYWRALGFV